MISGPAGGHLAEEPGVDLIDDLQQPGQELFEQARLAKSLGFVGVSKSCHYSSTPFQEIQQLPFLSRIAAEVPENGHTSWTGKIGFVRPLGATVEYEVEGQGEGRAAVRVLALRQAKEGTLAVGEQVWLQLRDPDACVVLPGDVA